jgi:hypothetical protein
VIEDDPIIYNLWKNCQPPSNPKSPEKNLVEQIAGNAL